ncbi:MAG: hypothetical protein M1834_005189 [Cirrosporium novae-zelandiae]|nr:MAG: hypothetical protein M1834_005189 [Cirrosporium novae-zelandiae]
MTRGGSDPTEGNEPNYTGPIVAGPNNYIIAVNLSSSWDWKLNISQVAINKTANPTTGTSSPIFQNGALFQGPPSDSQIYLYGGATTSINTSFPDWQQTYSNQYNLWGFDTESHEWSQYDVFSVVPDRPSWGGYSEAPDLGLAFWFNGVLTNYSSPSTSYLASKTLFLEGMVVLDLTNQTARNISTDSVTGSRPRARGGLQYVPGLGEKGVLVAFGGATGPESDPIKSNSSNLDVFDVAALNSSDPSSGWYTQEITGTVPDPRVDFCAVMESAPDNSSHNIYVYGGWDPSKDETYFDEIWVLSLPSFRWIKIFTGSSPRFGHTCHLVGHRQMITVGGLDNKQNNDSCDWEYKSVAIYDLTSGVWGSVFDAFKQSYVVMDIIYSAIGGNENGNATTLLPQGGWSSPRIAKLFTGTTDQNAAGSGSSASTSNSLSGGAIAGAVVGSIVGAILIVGALGFFLRKRKQRRAKRPEQPPPQEMAGDDTKYEMDSGGRKYELGGNVPAYEMPTQAVYAELPASETGEGNKPWSPTMPLDPPQVGELEAVEGQKEKAPEGDPTS